jgi:hypothetical protein
MRTFAFVLAVLVLAPAAARGALFPGQRLEADYRAALTSWARGDDDGAIAAVAGLAIRAEEQGQTARFEKARRAVARQLGRRQPDAYLAISRFETLVYQAQVGARQPHLALASRLLAAEVAEEHGDGGGAARSEAAAMVLGSLAAHLHLAAQEGAASDLYQRALALDPRQAAARLGLSALREKRGEYSAVVDLLSGLPEVPGGREGRLRLAINLLRVGRRVEGEAELVALSGEGTDWVRSVAAQELARLLVDRGQTDAAAAVLAAAAAALPCDSSLPVQAALLAERSGSDLPLDLASISDCGEASIAPRARYARAPGGEVRALRQRLEAAEGGWRTALGMALRAAEG